MRAIIITSLTETEQELLHSIKQKTKEGNKDNISRTEFYEQFYLRNKEIIWAFLASYVSRNAGWNMTDLEGEILKNLLPKKYREILFLTYERANWLIFTDAFPQLLLYEQSKREKKPLFHLLKYFHVSKFMEIEWRKFWTEKNIERLCTALIINEQHVIQKPVIEVPFYRREVFDSLPFVIEDHLHFSSVLFPTVEGKLYGYSVHGFKKVRNRIELGKRLSWLLFNSSEHKAMSLFATTIPHTGSRYDYEQFVFGINRRRAPKLREAYPVIEHHRANFLDWYQQLKSSKIERYFKNSSFIAKYDLTHWYYKKQKQLMLALYVEQSILKLLK